MIVLDTDVLTFIQHAGPDELDRLDRTLVRLMAEGPAAVTIVSFEEQTRGRLAGISKARTPSDIARAYDRLHAVLDDFAHRTVLDLTPSAADLYADLRKTYRRHGAADLKIAAITIAHGALLLSGNARDFAGIARLRFEPFRP